MRSHIAVALIAAAWAAAYPAMSAAGSVTSVFFRAGVATSTFTGSFSDGVGDYRSDFAGAIGCRWRLAPALSFQPELGWISRGGSSGKLRFVFESTFDTTAFEIKSDWVVDEIELPLLLRFERAHSGWAPYLIGGVAPAWRTGGEVRTGVGAVPATRPSPYVRGARIFEGLGDFNPVHDFKTFDLGAVGGVGVTFGHQTRAVLEARWIEGLLNVLPDYSEREGRNRSIVVSLGLEGLLEPAPR